MQEWLRESSIVIAAEKERSDTAGILSSLSAIHFRNTEVMPAEKSTAISATAIEDIKTQKGDIEARHPALVRRSLCAANQGGFE